MKDAEFCKICGICRSYVRENLIELEKEELIQIHSEIKKGEKGAGMRREISLGSKAREQLAASSRG